MTPEATDGKLAAVQQVLVDVLKLMELPLRVEVKGVEDGSIAAALFPDGEVQGFAPGKRSPVMEALQFWVNKAVNPPTGQRRWVALGVGDFPPPRQASAPTPVPLPAGEPNPPPPRAMAAPPPARSGVVAPPPHSRTADENTLAVAADAALTSAVQALAEKSARLGRHVAILGLSLEDRARVLQSTAAAPGVSVAAEGEGRHRRIVFRPDKPAPKPKAIPDDEDDSV